MGLEALTYLQFYDERAIGRTYLRDACISSFDTAPIANDVYSFACDAANIHRLYAGLISECVHALYIVLVVLAWSCAPRFNS